jgi:hypothetical protein
VTQIYFTNSYCLCIVHISPFSVLLPTYQTNNNPDPGPLHHYFLKPKQVQSKICNFYSTKPLKVSGFWFFTGYYKQYCISVTSEGTLNDQQIGYCNLLEWQVVGEHRIFHDCKQF